MTPTSAAPSPLVKTVLCMSPDPEQTAMPLSDTTAREICCGMSTSVHPASAEIMQCQPSSMMGGVSLSRATTSRKKTSPAMS